VVSEKYIPFAVVGATFGFGVIVAPALAFLLRRWWEFLGVDKWPGVW